MDSLNITYWATDTENRIDAFLMVWEHLKHIAEVAKVQGNCPVRISVRVARSRPRKVHHADK